MGCRLAKSDEWATRIMHEVKMHPPGETAFLTLTYAPEHLPANGSISRRELQLFIKRLRKEIFPAKIRFFGCGEYGAKGLRPHYHIIIFGYSFPDRTPWRRSRNNVLYRSAQLERVWTYGHCEIGTVTQQSAAYVARYCIKKVTGPMADDYYTRVDVRTGEIHRVDAEFIQMSTKPGIGSSWWDAYGHIDAFPSDYLIKDGRKIPVPAYYKRKLSEAQQDDVSRKRKANARLHADNNTPERLATREESAHLKAKKLKRDYETLGD